MFGGETGRPRTPHHGRPNARDLVGGDGHANARAANQHAPPAGSAGHPTRHEAGDIGIIDGPRGKGPHIDDAMALPAKERRQPFFGDKTAVIGAQGNFHV